MSRALNEGGLIIIMEQLTGKVFGSTAKALARLQALNFFNDLGAQTYSFDDIANWLTKSDYTNARRIALRKLPGFSLVLGKKTQGKG